MIVYFNTTKVQIMYCTSRVSHVCEWHVKVFRTAVVDMGESVADINGARSIFLNTKVFGRMLVYVLVSTVVVES